MEIKRKIKVPQSFIFSKIIESGLYDIEKHTGFRPSLKELNDYEYTKEFGKNQSGRIKFDQVTKPEVYAFSTYTNRATYHTRWELHPQNDGTTEVVISEKQDSNGFFQKTNDFLTGISLGWLKKRQMNAIVDSISHSYNGQ
ncbi:DUF3284 domain-containing protein [Floricoccus penangensis]|uniref:DUF3284 domain-containing protein n=1 Tax=Floricoccus penangensis TaxID=1859475 RepID=UPI00203F2FDF|nr:DUF3284 domain-containing protein [Floricoccus penangensis]URZ87297.1 DUF3284 domain-containing protein [Floricoccus penangensis]